MLFKTNHDKTLQITKILDLIAKQSQLFKVKSNRPYKTPLNVLL